MLKCAVNEMSNEYIYDPSSILFMSHPLNHTQDAGCLRGAYSRAVALSTCIDCRVLTHDYHASFCSVRKMNTFWFGSAWEKEGTLTPRCLENPRTQPMPVPQRLSPSLHTLDIIQTFNYETPLTVDSEARKTRTEAHTARAESVQLTAWATSKVQREKNRPKNISKYQTKVKPILPNWLSFVEMYEVSKGMGWFSNQAINKDSKGCNCLYPECFTADGRGIYKIHTQLTYLKDKKQTFMHYNENTFGKEREDKVRPYTVLYVRLEAEWAL